MRNACRRLLEAGLILALVLACGCTGTAPAPALQGQVPGLSESQGGGLGVRLRVRRGDRAVQFNGGYGAIQNDVARLVVGLFDNSPSTLCSGEGGTCGFPGTREVHYGAKGIFASNVFTNGTACNNAIFGDPVPGVSKGCYLHPVRPAFGYRIAGSATGSATTTALSAGNAPYLFWASEGVSDKLGTAGTGDAASGATITANRSFPRRYLVWDHGNGATFLSDLTETRFTNLPAADGTRSYVVFAAAWDSANKNLGYAEAAVADSLTQGGSAAAIQLTLNLKQGVFGNNLSQTPVLAPYVPDPAFSRVVATLAGSGSAGLAEGTGAAAAFSAPIGVAADGAGNLYVADQGNSRVRKVTAGGAVTSLAGSTSGFADGLGPAAQFRSLAAVAADRAGNVYVVDSYAILNEHRIRKIAPNGDVSTLAGGAGGYQDGPGETAAFFAPGGIAVDGAGNLYVADSGNHRIRKISQSGEVTTLAGSTAGSLDGTGTLAQFNNPIGVAVDGQGTLRVADSGNHRIRSVTQTGVVSTLAGNSQGYADGPGGAAMFDQPLGVAVDGAGNIYVTEKVGDKIRKVTPAGVVTTLAGSSQGFADGSAPAAKFNQPIGLAVDLAGNLYVSDQDNHRIRRIR